MKYFLSPQYYEQIVMKLNQILEILECVSWRQKYEKEGDNKNTKWEQSRDRYGYMVLNNWKNSY